MHIDCFQVCSPPQRHRISSADFISLERDDFSFIPHTDGSSLTLTKSFSLVSTQGYHFEECAPSLGKQITTKWSFDIEWCQRWLGHSGQTDQSFFSPANWTRQFSVPKISLGADAKTSSNLCLVGSRMQIMMTTTKKYACRFFVRHFRCPSLYRHLTPWIDPIKYILRDDQFRDNKLTFCNKMLHSDWRES